MTDRPRVVAIVQARMGSSRLPGKSLADIAGRPMIAHVLERAAASPGVDHVVMATSARPVDDPLAAAAGRLGFDVFRGSEDDVLDRFHGAAEMAGAGAVVRLTADNPLNDPATVGALIDLFFDDSADYASNVNPRSYPKGLDAEVVTLAALESAWREAEDPYEREHVTPFFYRRPERFRLANLRDSVDRSSWRWTVDEPADLEFARHVYSRLYRAGAAPFSFADVTALVDREMAAG